MSERAVHNLKLPGRQFAPKFPLRLLLAGYGTSGLGAVFLSMHGAGGLATGLTFWIGGAAAVFFWGGVWVLLTRPAHPRRERPVEFLAIIQRLVSAN